MNTRVCLKIGYPKCDGSSSCSSLKCHKMELYSVSYTTFPDKPWSKNKAKLFATSPLNSSDQIFQDEIGPGGAFYWTLQLLQHKPENLRRTFCLGLLLWSIGLCDCYCSSCRIPGNSKMWMATTGGEINDQTPPSHSLAFCPQSETKKRQPELDDSIRPHVQCESPAAFQASNRASEFLQETNGMVHGSS